MNCTACGSDLTAFKNMAVYFIFLMLPMACTPSLPDLKEAILVHNSPSPITITGKKHSQQLIETAAGSSEQVAHMKRFMQNDGAIASQPIYTGNRLKMLIDGPMAFEAIFEAMKNARHHIHVETFILDDGSLGRRFADILINRRKAGVAVRIAYDSFGVLKTDESFFKRLREHGIELYEFNPLDPIENPKVWRINQRHHSKFIIVDGKIVFIGGMNISSEYSISSFHSLDGKTDVDRGWRDTNLQIEGPVVAAFQKRFVQFWARQQNRPVLEGPLYLPESEKAGSALVRVVSSTAGDQEYVIYKVYLNAFHSAQHRIWITQGYFSPDPQIIRILKEAAKRNVDVRLLLPGVTDSWITISSSRAHYAELLKAGVRIFERKDALQHAKTAVVDGIWSTIGSANLDYRSFLHANEVNAVIYGRDFGRKMEELFLIDQEKNTEIFLEQWQKRPLMNRIKEILGSAVDYWL